MNIGRFYKDVTGKNPTVYRTAYETERNASNFSKLFSGMFLDLVFETLMVLKADGINESARNALAERIERLKPDLVA